MSSNLALSSDLSASIGDSGTHAEEVSVGSVDSVDTNQQPQTDTLMASIAEEVSVGSVDSVDTNQPHKTYPLETAKNTVRQFVQKAKQNENILHEKLIESDTRRKLVEEQLARMKTEFDRLLFDMGKLTATSEVLREDNKALRDANDDLNRKLFKSGLDYKDIEFKLKKAAEQNAVYQAKNSSVHHLQDPDTAVSEVGEFPTFVNIEPNLEKNASKLDVHDNVYIASREVAVTNRIPTDVQVILGKIKKNSNSPVVFPNMHNGNVLKCAHGANLKCVCANAFLEFYRECTEHIVFKPPQTGQECKECQELETQQNSKRLDRKSTRHIDSAARQAKNKYWQDVMNRQLQVATPNIDKPNVAEFVDILHKKKALDTAFADVDAAIAAIYEESNKNNELVQKLITDKKATTDKTLKKQLQESIDEAMSKSGPLHSKKAPLYAKKKKLIEDSKEINASYSRLYQLVKGQLSL